MYINYSYLLDTCSLLCCVYAEAIGKFVTESIYFAEEIR